MKEDVSDDATTGLTGDAAQDKNKECEFFFVFHKERCDLCGGQDGTGISLDNL